jgi:cell division protein FtsW
MGGGQAGRDKLRPDGDMAGDPEIRRGGLPPASFRFGGGEGSSQSFPAERLSAELSTPRVDRPFSFHLVWIVSVILLAFGLAMLYSVSSVSGFFEGDSDGLELVRQQGLVALAGLFLLVVVSRIDYRHTRWAAFAVVFLSLGLLVAVLVPGVGRGTNGAVRWMSVGGINLQPSEVAKLALVLMGAHLLSTRRALSGSFSALMWPLGGVAGILGALILAQPDLGTTIMLAVIVVGLLFAAGMRLRQWLGLVLGSAAGIVVLILSSDYRRERFLGFLDPFADPLDSGFQVVQSYLAMSSGGWFGVGPGRSIQKFNYLPEAHTDMIVGIIGEELGFVGVAAVLLLFFLLAAAALRLAACCSDPLGRYLITGAALLIAGQAVINAGGVTGLLPLTGIPLPFISFGRTNLMVVLVAVGIVLSVARYSPSVPAKERSPADRRSRDAGEESSNVTYLDRRRRHGRPRSAGLGHS